MVRIDCKGNVVLAEFEKYAVIARMGNCVEPFVAAYGYDFEMGSWSQGTYCNDLAAVWNIANPEVLENLSMQVTREYVSEILESAGYKHGEDEVDIIADSVDVALVTGWRSCEVSSETVSDIAEYRDILRLDDTCGKCGEFYKCPDSPSGKGFCRCELKWFDEDQDPCDCQEFCRRA